MGLFSFFKKSKKEPDTPLFEGAWQVIIKDGLITSINYNQVSVSIAISSISKVSIATNDSGPWNTDLWWIISDGNQELQIPGGATGEDELLVALQQLEGFDNEQLIKAMSSVENAHFICYSTN